MSTWALVVLGLAWLALWSWYGWATVRLGIERKANQKTYSDRISLIDAIRGAGLSGEQHRQFHELFELVSYTQHYREILAGRDPWALYDSRLTALAGKVFL